MQLGEFYRFQSIINEQKIKIKNGELKFPNKNYIYFSRTLNHHQYFALKKIKQILNKYGSIEVIRKNLDNNESYLKLKKEVCNLEQLSSCKSITIFVPSVLKTLIKDNAIIQNEGRTIELVDRKVYGGGYGFCDEWLKLVDSLTLASNIRRINDNDLLVLLKNLRYKIYSSSEAINLFSQIEANQTVLQQSVYDNFHKYHILELFETLIEKGLIIDDHTLKNSSRVGKKLIKEYNKSKDFVLKILDK